MWRVSCERDPKERSVKLILVCQTLLGDYFFILRYTCYVSTVFNVVRNRTSLQLDPTKLIDLPMDPHCKNRILWNGRIYFFVAEYIKNVDTYIMQVSMGHKKQ